VGKSCLLLRFVDNSYTDEYISTIGADYKIKDLDIDGGRVRLQVWDTAGQERFRTITSSFYRGSHGIMVVYDVTAPESFENVRSWLQEVQRYAAENVVVVLVANKTDNAAARKISPQQGQQLADEQGIAFIETSAKTGANVDAAFFNIANELKSKVPSTASPQVRRAGVNISRPVKQKKKCLLL
jgi:small GTP-binding protein